MEILETGLTKWKIFHKDFICEGMEYKLLFEDGTEARFLPGQTKEFFTLSRYKEELGRDYRRITLFLCAQENFERNYSCIFDSPSYEDDWYMKDISGGEGKLPKNDCRDKNEVPCKVNLVDEPGETCSEGAIESTSASFKDACADVDMMTCRDNNEEAASFMIPEDFLWGTVSDVVSFAAVFLGRHATLPQKEPLLTSKPHSFPVISQLQLGFHFQEPSRAKFAF